MENRTTIQVSEDLRKQLKVLAARRDISYQELLQDMISVFRELDREKTIISIPAMLAGKINEKISKTDFSSVSEYTAFVLRQMLLESADKEKISDSDEEKIKDKLRKLGYLWGGKMKVDIPDEMVEKLKKRVESTDEFESVEKYVNYILKQVVERLESEQKDEEPVFSEEDEEKVKDRLRSLGYLD